MPESLPVLHCRGTHYEVGYHIGRTFQHMIRDLLGSWKYFNDIILKIGSTIKGRALMETSLELCRIKYPDYISEIKGMADGAGIEFEKLFMLNIDSILCTLEAEVLDDNEGSKKRGGTGCTTIICNKGEAILGHTEDAMAEIKNHVYIVSAEILSNSENDDDAIILEKFSTLCYAGTLMGYTMGFNNHGMIYSVNTIFPTVYTTGTPRAFIARSLLGASDLPNLINLLKDKGNGVADGFSLNVYFYPKNSMDTDYNEGCSKCKAVFYNIEVAPPKIDDEEVDDCEKVSVVDVHEIQPGIVFTHCNRYLRVNTNECNPTAIIYSDKRTSVICKCEEPYCEGNIREILSNQTDYDYPIYNNGKENGDGGYAMNFIRTVAIGIFNINRRTWSVYTDAPALAEPAHVFVID